MAIHQRFMRRCCQPLASANAPCRAVTQYSMGLYVLFFGTKKIMRKLPITRFGWVPASRNCLPISLTGRSLPMIFVVSASPTATDPSFAPEGCDSFYVLCPVPNLLGKIDWRNWSFMRDQFAALGDTIMPGLEAVITEDFWMTPNISRQITVRCMVLVFNSPIFAQSAWFRYHNRDPHIQTSIFLLLARIQVPGCQACFVLLRWLRL